MILTGVVYVGIGVFAGLMAGALGIGGGVVVVPGLVFLFQINHLIPPNLIMHVAVGTSLGVMVLTSQAALIAHHQIGTILWSIFNKLWPGIIAGSVMGAVFAQYIPTYWLSILFALFLLFVAFKIITDMRRTHIGQFPKSWVNWIVTLFIGITSGLLGVGGGVLIVPYLTHCGVPVRDIAPVSSLGTVIVGVTGSIVLMLIGSEAMRVVPYSTGYIYWPAVFGIAVPSCMAAPFGARLNYIVPVRHLKYGFIVILIVTAIKMLF